MEKAGTLSVVATPIGNLEDMTHRAVRVLGEADYVLCEDTRVTGKLLKHYGVITTLKRYDAHASDAVHERVLADLAAGKRVALVSDAGTPGVSDPGVRLVREARATGARLETIPGPSALTAAVSIAGLSGNQFTFLGFVPQKKGRETFFKRLAGYEHPVVFFESTHRIMKTLDALTDALSPDWTVSVARELTKLHEELVSGSPAEIREYFMTNTEHQKGEFVLIVTPPTSTV
jgi:16S rRNA (cytidine1402-2'-O)-methyltransferase